MAFVPRVKRSVGTYKYLLNEHISYFKKKKGKRLGLVNQIEPGKVILGRRKSVSEVRKHASMWRI